MGGKLIDVYQYLVTTIDRNGDREIRKEAVDKKDAIAYARTVEKKRLPEVWKKIDRRKENEN